MDNRELILQSALDLFYMRGYESTGVQEIAERAGITKPTLYYYFGSKAGLLKELLESRFLPFIERMKKAASGKGDITNTLNEVAGEFFSFSKENRKFTSMMLSSFYSARESEVYQIVNPMVVHIYRVVLDVFESRRHELGNMNGREKQFAVGFTGILNHYFLLQEEMGNEEFTEKEIHSIVHQFLHGIYS